MSKRCSSSIQKNTPQVQILSDTKGNNCIPVTSNNEINAKPVLLTRCDQAGVCDLLPDDIYIKRRLPDADGNKDTVPERFPIMNIRTDKSVMSGHNDIWSPTLKSFLKQLLTTIQTKPEDLNFNPI